VNYKDSFRTFPAEIPHNFFELAIATMCGKVVLFYPGLESEDISSGLDKSMLKRQPAVCAFNL